MAPEPGVTEGVVVKIEGKELNWVKGKRKGRADPEHGRRERRVADSSFVC